MVFTRYLCIYILCLCILSVEQFLLYGNTCNNHLRKGQMKNRRKEEGEQKGKREGRRSRERERWRVFFLSLKKLRVAEDILFSQWFFSESPRNIFYWKETGHQFSVTIVFFTPICLQLHLPLEELFKSLKPTLPTTSNDRWWRAVYWVSFNFYLEGML